MWNALTYMGVRILPAAGAGEHHLWRARLDGPARGAARRGRRRARPRPAQRHRLPGGAPCPLALNMHSSCPSWQVLLAALQCQGTSQKASAAGSCLAWDGGWPGCTGQGLILAACRCMQVDIVPNAGHFPFIDEPRIFLQQLLRQTEGVFPDWHASRQRQQHAEQSPPVAAEAG